jgi:hypothetical protein
MERLTSPEPIFPASNTAQAEAPFPLDAHEPPGTTEQTNRTGCAGRPTKSKALLETYIRQEFSRFKDMLPTAIAKETLAWAAKNHAGVELPKQRSFANSVREIKRRINKSA